MASIYVLEDDDLYAGALGEALRRRGHDVRTFGTPHALFYELNKLPPRCLIVDWLLPEMNGFEVVKRVRQLLGSRVGIVMLTAVDAEDKVVDALNAGADDYVVKPATEAILAVRIDALLRRLVPAQVAHAKHLELGPYRLDLATRAVSVEGESVELAPREFDLAWTLFSQPSRLFTKQELLASIWGRQTEYGCHTIAQHVYALRKKLSLAAHGLSLLSVYGTGYRLECTRGAVVTSPAATMRHATVCEPHVTAS